MKDLKRYNYTEEGLGKLIEQYKSSNIKDLITPFIKQVQDLEQANHDVYMRRCIDKGEGVQLDIIGRIVGQPRELINVNLISYFGFLGAAQSNSFGDLNDRGVGGRFRSVDENPNGNIKFDDVDYRKVLKARIEKNYTDCSVESIIKSSRAVLDSPDLLVEVIEGQSLYLFNGDGYAELENPLELQDFDLDFNVTISDAENTNSTYLGSDTSEFIKIANTFSHLMNTQLGVEGSDPNTGEYTWWNTWGGGADPEEPTP